MIERRLSLRQWAKLTGITHETLSRWLQVKYVLPRVARGSKLLVRESQIEAILRDRTPQDDWTRHGARRTA